MNPLAEYLLGSQKRTEYNAPLLQSYAGYPVISAQQLGLTDYFNKDGKSVAGMAWGGKSNPPGQGQGERSSIVVNPSYFNNDARGHNALVKLEASRHWMNESGYAPKFKITPEMQKWREDTFGKAGPAGEAYLKNDDAFRQTLVSRFIGGDSNVPAPTPELQKEVSTVQKQIEALDKKAKPTIADMVMQAIQIKRK